MSLPSDHGEVFTPLGTPLGPGHRATPYPSDADLDRRLELISGRDGTADASQAPPPSHSGPLPPDVTPV